MIMRMLTIKLRMVISTVNSKVYAVKRWLITTRRNRLLDGKSRVLHLIICAKNAKN